MANQNRFEDLLTEKIYDNVYGFISLTKDEKKLLESPYMQRLHFINQLAVANFVFPGATHTRFSHSIGVLHITEKIIQRLKQLDKIDITIIDHQIIRLAALLHDIGHYPLSHTLESSYMEYDKTCSPPTIENKKPNSKLSNDFKGINDDKLEKSKAKYRNNNITIVEFLEDLETSKTVFHHERIAKKVILSSNFSKKLDLVIDKIIKKYNKKTTNQVLESKDQVNAYKDLICEIIKGEPDYLNNIILKDQEKQQQKYYILSQIINSNLDADQMDYMCRDTKNTGIKTTVRIDFLINNMDICNKEFTDKNGNKYHKKALCFNIKALQSIDQFLLSKFNWYSEILSYDKVYILDLIAKRLNLFMLLSDNINRYCNEVNTEAKLNELIESEQDFFFFNDSFFWNKIQSLIKDETVPVKIKYLATFLLNRATPAVLNMDEFEEKIKDTEYSFASHSPRLLYENDSFLEKLRRNDFEDTVIRNKDGAELLPVVVKHPIFKTIKNNPDSTVAPQNEYLFDRNINIKMCNKKKCDINGCNEIKCNGLFDNLKEHSLLGQFYTLSNKDEKKQNELNNKINEIEKKIIDLEKENKSDKDEKNQLLDRKWEYEKEKKAKKLNIEAMTMYKFIIFNFGISE